MMVFVVFVGFFVFAWFMVTETVSTFHSLYVTFVKGEESPGWMKLFDVAGAIILSVIWYVMFTNTIIVFD